MYWEGFLLVQGNCHLSNVSDYAQASEMTGSGPWATSERNCSASGTLHSLLHGPHTFDKDLQHSRHKYYYHLKIGKQKISIIKNVFFFFNAY
jgi:hypothetical protein